MIDTTMPLGETRSGSRPRRRPPHLRFGAPVSWATPALAWYLVFMIGPLVAIFYLSQTKWAMFAAPRTYVGFDNFRRVFTDQLFFAAVRNSLVQLVAVVPLTIGLAFMLGYYLTQRPRGHAVLRFLFFTPVLISMSAKAMIFLTVFAPTGLINGTLRLAGLEVLTRAWLANPDTALPVIIALDLWGGVGFTAILFSARLAGIPTEVHEAAALDGATGWSQMWRISYPIAKDYVGVLTMLQFLGTLFYSAGNILLLTRGGPGTSTTTLSYLVYSKAFMQSDIGYSQAVAVVLFLVGLLGMVLIRRSFRQDY